MYDSRRYNKKKFTTNISSVNAARLICARIAECWDMSAETTSAQTFARLKRSTHSHVIFIWIRHLAIAARDRIQPRAFSIACAKISCGQKGGNFGILRLPKQHSATLWSIFGKSSEWFIRLGRGVTCWLPAKCAREEKKSSKRISPPPPQHAARIEKIKFFSQIAAQWSGSEQANAFRESKFTSINLMESIFSGS